MLKKKMNKLLSLVLAVLLMVGILPAVNVSAAEEPSGNWSSYAIAPSLSGTTYTISSAENLAWVANQVNNWNMFNGYTFDVTSEIDLSEHYWTPIGGMSGVFRGTLNGNDYSITGLRIGTADSGETSYQYFGLFGATDSAKIKNINLEDVAIYASYDRGYLGGLIGSAYNSSISGCSVSCSIMDGTGLYYEGGLVGWLNGGSATNCHTTGTVDGTDICMMGGLIGYAGYTTNTATVADSYSECNVTGHTNATSIHGSRSVGGCIGQSMRLQASECYATGKVSGDGPLRLQTGGFIGSTGADYLTEIVNCYATGNVTCYNGISGGFIGICESGTKSNNDDYIRNCSAWGNVESANANSYLGGFIGFIGNYRKIENCFARGDITDDQYSQFTGSFIGRANMASITNCYASGAVKSSHSFVGYFDETTFDCCYYNSSKNTGSDGIGLATPLMRADESNADSLVNLLNQQVAANAASGWTTWTVKNGSYPVLHATDQAAPTGLGTVNPANGDSNDGQITNIDSTMEYIPAISTDDQWTAVTSNSVAGLDEETYYVRYAEKPGFYPSESAEVTLVDGSKSSEKEITSFLISSYSGTIDGDDHTIRVTVPYGTDVTSLTPTITVSDKAAVSPLSGVAQNFTNPVVYTVTAENGTKQIYTVTVTVAPDPRSSAKEITSFKIGGVDGTINTNDYTIAVTLPYGTDVTSLTPTITLSDKAGVTPASGAAQDFTSPVVYTVEAENESTQTYTVTVNVSDKILTSITTPTAITGLTNGTAKTATALELPSTVTLVTDNGNVQANVSWNVASCSYSTSSSSAQTFTVSGTVTLPDGVVNTNSVSLTISISVSVNKASSSGGGSGSGGSSGRGNTSTAANNSSITVTTDAGTNTAAQTVSAATGSNGVATASVTKDQIVDMMKAASEKAQEQKTRTALEIKIDSGSAATGVSLTIPQAAVSSLKNGVNSLTISSPVVTVTFDEKALAEIGKNTNGDITVKAVKPEDTALSDEDKAVIGTRPVYDLKVASGSTTISSFGGGTATVSVPYTPAAGEDTSKIVVYYISGSGELIIVPDCVYDNSTGTVTFKTTHFSSYAVGYNDISFTDVSGWCETYVNYLAARGIITGTGNGKFGPDANITRAQFVTILANLSGNDLSSYTSSTFRDVSTGNWYFEAVQWANKNGIASGYDSAFKPNANITREQMAVMLFNYAKYAGIDVSNVEGMSVREFSDYGSISNYAMTPVQWAINDSIVSGNADGSFAPKAKATRAQAAKMITILLQGIIKDEPQKAK